MHEETVLADLVRKVDTVARESGGRPVVRARIWIGALSHLTEDQLRARWPIAARGTLAEEAQLEVTRSPDPTDLRAQAVVLTSIDVRAEEAPPD